MLELVIFVGLPGSGKSTYYREHYAATHVHVSKDLMPNARSRDDQQRKLIEQALAAGKSVVVDNTNPSRDSRAALIAIGKRFGAHVIGYFFDVDVRACIVRNREREGRARVPEVAIFTTKKKLQPPDADEGFDEVHCIS
jgi:predicted kinase